MKYSKFKRGSSRGVKYRSKTNRRKDRRIFTRTADKTHEKNLRTNVTARGGIRL